MAPTITIDGNDVTNLAVSGSWTRRLNRPSQAQVTIPFTDEVGGPGSRLKIVNGGTTVFHGMCLLVETNPDENFGYTVYNATDPMELWQWRPVRDDTCDFSKPTIIDDYITGPEIIEAALTNTVTCGGGGDDDDEGPIFLTMGTFETGGCNLTGAPTDWPMTIAQLASLLISTGCLDLVITPTDPGGGVMGTIAGYNGDYGTDRSATVVFEYGTGAFNISKFRRAQDMTNMCNKLWYYGGPRIQTAADPAGDQHWCFNVTGDDPLLPDPIPNGESLATLLANRATSRTTYGVRMDIQIFDAYDDNCIPGIGTPGRDLYRTRWETESWIRQQPRDLVHVTPTRETAIGSFDIGDLVGIEIPILGISAAQRVYEYTVSWDTDGVLALSELQTSPTADG
jgi:hypothetical protein